MLVDFSAEWCLTCKVFEKTVLHTEPVEKAIADSGAVTMYADYTDYPPEIEQHDPRAQEQRRAGDRDLPGDRPYEPIVFRDGYTAQGLITALKQATADQPIKSEPAVASTSSPLN